MGIGNAMPFAGVLFFIGSLALAGIPPTNGFISKYYLFKSGLDLRALFPIILISLGGLFSLIYTIRAFQKIWWKPLPEGVMLKERGDQLIAPTLLVLLILFLGFWSEPLVNFSQVTSNWLLDPNNYIQAVFELAVSSVH
jgi:formate hydrogenlyase subunit 3/multisubunit Na+/H+ antiporter MnhD subunit